MKHFRKERMESLLQEHLSAMILREIEVPGALVSITRIENAKKLENAKVYVSVFPSEKGNDALHILKHNAKHFEYELVRALNLKPIPEILFILDHGIENASAVEKALMSDEKEI